jgi:hypothetical protein
MSLIKAVDVPKHMAERLRSRRVAARLTGSQPKKPIVPGKDPVAPTSLAQVELPRT